MNKYSTYSKEKLQEHLDLYLIEHWSISAISSFIGNEKGFERKYIFRDYDEQKSLASIIGTVYHKALSHFFKQFQETGERLSYDKMLMKAYVELETVGANKYRPQKKKTIEELKLEANKIVNFLITSFLNEVPAYLDEIQEILFVERPFKEFIQINGVDVPLPIKIIPDLVFIDKEGYLCIADHKSKKTYTDEKEVNAIYSNQSIGYVLGLNAFMQRLEAMGIIEKYPKAAEGVKKFFFYENKYTKNSNGSRQIKQIPIIMDDATVLFYEQMLFEGVFRVMDAVSNPDYVYLMNPNDHFEDKENMVKFWVKTHIEGLEGFPKLKPRQVKILKRRRDDIRRSALTGIPKSIVRSYTQPTDFVSLTPEDMEDLSNERKIEHRLRTFNYPVRVEHTIEGYSCDTYLLQIAAGLKTAQIYGFSMDIANVLGVASVRISPDLVPYKKGSYIAIEVNREKQKPLMLSDSDIPDGTALPIGKDNFGNTHVWDVGNPTTPHLMIAGASGSGKSVAIKTLIDVIERKKMDVVILDPKFEFLDFKDKGFKVFNELEEIEAFMEAEVVNMNKIFSTHGARGNSANKRIIIFDEAADCFTRQTKERKICVDKEGYEIEKPKKRVEDAKDRLEIEELRAQWAAFNTAKTITDKSLKTLEENTLILSQKARSAGIHLVLAAQRFSVKVLTGDAKANFSTRLCLSVSSGTDSKVMLDQEGAEKLRGKGDALITSPEHSNVTRIQCFATESALN